jgi:Mg2+-importing ATPase
VLAAGVLLGRTTHANTLKYIYYTTSANFGNMLSMAAASLWLPFLPLLPKQILLNNLLSDLPALAIAADNVDAEQLARPDRLDIREIRRFMLVFGTVSSAFDLFTFAALIRLASGDAARFQTGWFMESLLTELLVLFVMRSRSPIGTTRPSTPVIALTAAAATLALVSPYLGPVSRVFGLVPLPIHILGSVVGITVAYVLVTEAVRRRFWATKPT